MDSPRALAVRPTSGASSTRKISSHKRPLSSERFIARLAQHPLDAPAIERVSPKCNQHAATRCTWRARGAHVETRPRVKKRANRLDDPLSNSDGFEVRGVRKRFREIGR